MQYNITIDEFEGPLDLLLHLIQRHEIDLYNIPVAQITEQYLSYIHTMQELQLDVASEFLVMAASLLEMKSRMLLPKHEEIDDDFLEQEEEDPRQELMNRLIEYKKYKEAAKELKDKEYERSLLYSRPKADLSQYGEVTVEDKLAGDLSLYDMLSAFQKLLKRKKLQKPLKTRIARQEISIETTMSQVLEKVQDASHPIKFETLFEEGSKEALVVTFLALLELMKHNQIVVFQERNFEDLYIKKA
ncbi:MAG: segregation/condensation protein A [Bacillaceae bacterium]